MRTEAEIDKSVAAYRDVFLLLGFQLDGFGEEIIKLAVLHVKLLRQGNVDDFTEASDVEKLRSRRKRVVLLGVKVNEPDRVVAGIWLDPVDEVTHHGLFLVLGGNLPFCDIACKEIADTAECAELKQLSVRLIIFNLLDNGGFVEL